MQGIIISKVFKFSFSVDSFELNKIAAALLIALLVAAVANQISKSLVYPIYLEQKSYHVEITDQQTPFPSEAKSEPAKDITPLLAKADIANGEKVFKKCTTCHTVAKNQSAKIGPNLWNIVLAPIAKATDYVYSTALKGKTGNWTVENLNQFLHKPREFAPGTKMTFIGVTNDQERADVIAYLRQQADTPAPLP